MFPDSEIAKKFSCGATKAAYLICFGLGPYFKEQRINDIRKAPCYVVSFDECLNKVAQTEQLDVVVRHWSEREGKVVVHYFDSEFLGHTQAEKLLERIKRALSPLNPNKLLQISMDGPAVNWKLLRIFQEDKSQKDPDAPKMIHLGSCGLHVLHGSFQDGERETGWKVGDVLRALWQMFHDSPARRADFIEVTKTTTFPLKFCAHRWVEDLAVAERAVEVWPAVQQYISSHQKLPKSKLKSFLEKFQTDAPMVPFLAKELESILRCLLSCFIKREELEKIKTPVQLLKLDIQNKSIHVPLKQLDTGFATKQALETASKKLLENPVNIQVFKKECVSFLAVTCKKIMERSPLMYPAVRHMSSLDPVIMVTETEHAIAMFEKLLQVILNAGWCTASECDKILAQYKIFSVNASANLKAEFQDFSYSCRLEEFFGRFISGRAENAALWDMMKCLLTLSHGQAAVERGYSVNKDMLVENLKERSLIALRLVQDAMAERAVDEALPKDLIQHCKGARMRYMQYLEDEKKNKEQTANEKKRKELHQDIENVKAKQRRIMKSSEMMQKEADEMAMKAEKKQDFTLLSKSNAYRKSVAEKKEELQALAKTLEDLQESIKKLQ
ncbi:unnamed protein product [Leuciscus chuanchicus]